MVRILIVFVVIFPAAVFSSSGGDLEILREKVFYTVKRPGFESRINRLAIGKNLYFVLEEHEKKSANVTRYLYSFSPSAGGGEILWKKGVASFHYYAPDESSNALVFLDVLKGPSGRENIVAVGRHFVHVLSETGETIYKSEAFRHDIKKVVLNKFPENFCLLLLSSRSVVGLDPFSGDRFSYPIKASSPQAAVTTEFLYIMDDSSLSILTHGGKFQGRFPKRYNYCTLDNTNPSSTSDGVVVCYDGQGHLDGVKFVPESVSLLVWKSHYLELPEGPLYDERFIETGNDEFVLVSSSDIGVFRGTQWFFLKVALDFSKSSPVRILWRRSITGSAPAFPSLHSSASGEGSFIHAIADSGSTNEFFIFDDHGTPTGRFNLSLPSCVYGGIENLIIKDGVIYFNYHRETIIAARVPPPG